MSKEGRRHDRYESEALEALYWRDEILQVMYWLLEEGFGQEVTSGDLLRFLDADEPTIERQLERLMEEGYIEALDGDAGPLPQRRYRLTGRGTQEGRRRFVDEFEPLLQRGGHGGCGQSDCECHRAESSDEACRSSPEGSLKHQPSPI